MRAAAKARCSSKPRCCGSPRTAATTISAAIATCRSSSRRSSATRWGSSAPSSSTSACSPRVTRRHCAPSSPRSWIARKRRRRRRRCPIRRRRCSTCWRSAAEMAEITFLRAIHDGIHDEMERDPSVFVLGQDVGAKGGVFGVTEGLQKEFGEWRVLDSPLAESLIAGVAVGAACNGMRPIAEIQFQDFILPAVDQIVSEAAKFRYRSNGDWNVPMVVRAPFGGGVHGALYHSQSLEAIFCHIPGLRVVAPSTPYDAKGMIVSAIRDPDPVLYFEHKRAYRAIKGEVPEGEYTVQLDS